MAPAMKYHLEILAKAGICSEPGELVERPTMKAMSGSRNGGSRGGGALEVVGLYKMLSFLLISLKPTCGSQNLEAPLCLVNFLVSTWVGEKSSSNVVCFLCRPFALAELLRTEPSWPAVYIC